MLSGRDLTLRIGTRTLLDGVTLSVEAKERVALVGENGAGKSTLLQVLAGRLPPEDGEVHRVRGARVELLGQEPDLDPNRTVVEVVRSGLSELFALLEEHRALCAAPAGDAGRDERIAELGARIEDRGGFDVEHRVEEVLDRLSIRARHEKVGTLSGGERRRTDLARVLLGRPDVILLDEPTNHLDRGAISFLRETLIASGAAVLLISHDRAFIDDVATRIVELDRGRLYGHPVPYQAFLEGRLLRQDIDARTLRNKERLVARELAWLRAGTPARTTKQNARKGRAEALIDEVSREVSARRERTLEVQRARGKRLAKTILELKGLSLQRGDKRLFDGLDLILTEGERWGIVGDNGAGKTSLLKAVLGELEPAAGEIVIGPHTRFAVFDQHREQLSGTVEEVLCPDGGDYVHVGDERVHIATWLERFLFSGEDRRRPVDTLSGGEQNRLLLSRLFAQGANCLLLDEPTNDLDVETLGVLEDALLDHDGVALLVSHDRRFLDRVCTGILAFEDAKVVPYQGDYTNYERLKARFADVDSAAPRAKKTEAAEREPRREREKKKRSYKEELEYQQMEARVLEAEEKKEALLKELDDGKLYASDAARAAEVSAALEALEGEIERLYARWQELEGIGA